MLFLFASIFIALNSLVDSANTMTENTLKEFCEHYNKADLLSTLEAATKSVCLASNPPCSNDCEQIFIPGTDFCLEKTLVAEAKKLGYNFGNLQLAEGVITKRLSGKCLTLSKTDCDKDDECESCKFDGLDICGAKTTKVCNAAVNLETRTDEIMKAASEKDIVKILDSDAKSGSSNKATGTVAVMVALSILSVIAVL